MPILTAHMLSGAISPNMAAAQCNDVIIRSLQQYLRLDGLITDSSHTLSLLTAATLCGNWLGS